MPLRYLYLYYCSIQVSPGVLLTSFTLEYYCRLVAAVIVVGLIFVATWPFRDILSEDDSGGGWPGFDDDNDGDGGGGGNFPATKPY